MNMKLTPALKGLITGLLMIGIALASFYGGLPADSPLQYMVYFTYAAGIVWTIMAYQRSETFTGKFWDAFNQGFRCFIIVTLIMVVFTVLFSKMHPEFATETARMYKEQLLKEAKSKTPAEIEEEVTRYKNGYTTMLVYSSIFGYLIIGAAVTAVTAAITTRRR
ncbi:MAG: DUF4199 domain-containing protein [Sphingobacteriales bacterium]|nr:DUF4199 domain-containing protein [Sphingobacteriales bacterium]